MRLVHNAAHDSDAVVGSCGKGLFERASRNSRAKPNCMHDGTRALERRRGCKKGIGRRRHSARHHDHNAVFNALAAKVAAPSKEAVGSGALGFFKALAAKQQLCVFAEPAPRRHAVSNVQPKGAAVAVGAALAEPPLRVLLAGALDFWLGRRCGSWNASAHPSVLAAPMGGPADSLAFGGRHAFSVVQHSTILAQAAATIFLVPAWCIRTRVAIPAARARGTVVRCRLAPAFRVRTAVLSRWRRRR